jgi:TetR/AcrR family transcriptional regulator, transcriptional repressor for nem operon
MCGGMGTKGEETKQRIIHATRRLLRYQGYADTSIDDICKEAGVTRGNLYFYFKSKEELACIAVEDSGNRHIPFFQTLMEDEPDPLKRIELLIDGIIGYYAARGDKASCLFGKIAQEVGDSNRPIAETANRFFLEWGQMLGSEFEQAKKEGLISMDADGESLAYLVISGIEGALILYKASKDPNIFLKVGHALKSVITELRE